MNFSTVITNKISEHDQNYLFMDKGRLLSDKERQREERVTVIEKQSDTERETERDTERDRQRQGDIERRRETNRQRGTKT